MKKNIMRIFGKKFLLFQQILTALLCIVAVIYFMPRDKVFNYHFSKDTPWAYSQLMASFNFPIYKSAEQMEAEQDSVRRNFAPYFAKDTTTYEIALKRLRDKYYGSFNEIIPLANYLRYKKRLQEIYDRGILSSGDLDRPYTANAINIKLITENISTTEPIDRFLKIPDAYRLLTQGDTLPQDIVNSLRLDELLVPNIRYDSLHSEKSLKQELESLSESDGLVQKGQKIIARGDIVDEKLYQILESYRLELDKRHDDNRKTTLMLIGQILFVVLCFGSLLAYIYIYATEVSRNLNMFLLVVLSATLFPIIVGIMMQLRFGNVFMLPFALVPLLLCLFTSRRTAFLTHTISIIMCSVMLTSPYEFVLLQIPVGVVAMICMKEFSARSQMLRCALYIFLFYALFYFAYEMIIENSVSKLNLAMYLYFVISAVLLLFAYPLMFIIEKLFGFVSNVTLIEISNINSELLRKLSQDAPGTFQHSMQVGNLAADAARSIGANSLEVRTGALFHDIGKTLNPIYFTENQSGGISPHSKLEPQESAKIIIKHVTDGIALAEKHHLPRTIRDFITTHHGLSKTGYFYITYKNAHPDEEVDENLFTYPGPQPTTREQGILMLADCVEAASHSLKEYTAENIDELVERLVESKVKDGELKMCPLTFRDIENIKRTFKDRLKAIYHTRITYPTEKKK
ncbi:MAG: HDIG domain-containing protein [Bacteroidaceae bacterium]|nr:HDIG domain-containing protein [Bacteroidaceae bacterium]